MGIVLMINNTPIHWISKRQKTRDFYIIWFGACRSKDCGMLGVPIKGPAMMLGDKKSVILNMAMPSSMLKKKHNAIAYHRICIFMNDIRGWMLYTC